MIKLNIKLITFLIFLFLLNLTLSCDNSSSRKTKLEEIKKKGIIRVGIRSDNPPHSFISKDGQLIGFDVDIARSVSKQLGCQMETVKVDELTRISYLQRDIIDIAVASMSHTRKREKEVDFSQTYFWSKQTFLVKKGEINSLDELVNKTVGMSRGSHSIGNWHDWLKKNGYLETPQIVEFSSKQAAVEAVLQGAMAGWAEDMEVLVRYAEQDPLLSVLTNESIGVKQDGIGIPENESDLRDEINFALQSIFSSGEYHIIYDKWFGENTDTPIPLEYSIEIWPNG